MLIQFILIIILLYWFYNNPRIKEVKVKDHSNTTDTIYLPKEFSPDFLVKMEKIIREGQYAPPSQVIKYLPEYIPTRIEITPDSILLLVDELKDSLEIAKNYLVNFPNKPKLITLGLTQNELELTLLNISGGIETSKYPLFLNKYDYTHTGDSLIYDKAKNPDPNLISELYGTAGYSILNKNPYIGLRYQVNYKTILVEANSIVTVKSNPDLFLTIGAALRIK